MKKETIAQQAVDTRQKVTSEHADDVQQTDRVRRAVNTLQVVNTQMIDDYIKENGLTKAGFCRLCKIGVPTLNRILSGQDFKNSALFKIAKAMNIQVHQLLIK